MNETQNNRRDFFKEAGKRALWVAPTITLLMTAGSQPALATKNGYADTKPEYKKKKYSGSKSSKSSKSSKKKSYKGSR